VRVHSFCIGNHPIKPPAAPSLRLSLRKLHDARVPT
jgi:hypothetical protein